MDPEAVAALSDPVAWELLQSLPPYDEGSALALSTRLRTAGHDPSLVAAVLTQSRLRARGRVKFGDRVDQMLLTPDGVEQSTRWQLAQRHARRFLAAGVDTVWDLGCGLGGDALALSSIGLCVDAVDADPATTAIATVNLRDLPGVTVRQGLIEDLHLQRAPGRGAWLDPARRLPGHTDQHGRARRTFSLDQLAPTWATVQEVAARLGHVGAKLAPSFPRDAVPAGAEAQWASFGGEALECTIWWGDLVQRPGRSAQVHTGPADGGQWLEVHDDGGGPAPAAEVADEVGGWLYEPDRAVLQAGLTGTLARLVRGIETAPGAGYVTGPDEVDIPWARRFQVLSVHPLSVKPLRRWARESDIGALTIKKRGVSVDPDRLRRDLRLSGSRDVVVVLSQLAGRPTLIEVEPVVT
ncbi:class I SAM-dependent methyltransferase [Ornithinimicrobium faecis]|uniref:Class I SAM-dependent methyltransferase n=1 Tax=Ornithinimicrobium faecis TaxID=2934158 RepID=A0ABY4YPX0_9MICO|nr:MULTISPECIES: class I SAM-dependent methyltransferase [unclassified Ornithinimicrobium]USQ78823.1 class I SAM-dependent methyltransferase [Ornithinimicrobium sp. HY1793]